MRELYQALLLPIDDGPIDALSPAERADIASIWRARSSMEQHVAAGFSVILRELIEAGGDIGTIELVGAAIPHELEHSRLCLSLASRYAGHDVTPLPPEPLRVPDFITADKMTLVTLHLAGMSCINETIASVRLAEEIATAKSPTIVRALTAIAEDETVHARAGYSHLASQAVTRAAKSELSRLLPVMLRAAFDGLAEENAFLPRGYPDHGLPSCEDTLALAAVALRDVVLPGFAYVGIDIGASKSWAASRFEDVFRAGVSSSATSAMDAR